MRIAGSLLTAALVLAAAGCSGTDPQGAGSPSAAPAPSVAETDAQQSEAAMQSTGPAPSVSPFYEVGDVDGGLAPYVDQARTELARRLGVDATSIETRAAVLVVWPDGAMGCPQKDMQYTQAQEDGSVIELDHGGSTYRFHTGGARGPFLCETPVLTPPVRADGGGA